jgi:hypothetical protein
MLFSNKGQGAATLVLSGCAMALGACVLYVLDRVRWVWRGLVEIAVSRLKSTAGFRIGAVIHTLRRAVLPLEPKLHQKCDG